MTRTTFTTVEAAVVWSGSKGISDSSRETFRAVRDGGRVTPEQVTAAVIDALAVNATRYGQSVARRAGAEAALTVYRAYVTEQPAPNRLADDLTLADEQEDRTQLDEIVFLQHILSEEQRRRLADFRAGYRAAKK